MTCRGSCCEHYHSQFISKVPVCYAGCGHGDVLTVKSWLLKAAGLVPGTWLNWNLAISKLKVHYKLIRKVYEYSATTPNDYTNSISPYYLLKAEQLQVLTIAGIAWVCRLQNYIHRMCVCSVYHAKTFDFRVIIPCQFRCIWCITLELGTIDCRLYLIAGANDKVHKKLLAWKFDIK